MTHLNLSVNLIGGTPYQSGALISFADNTESVTIRVGVSFVSAEQACDNAESEVGDASFEDIVARSRALWQDKLKRIEIDVANTPPNVTEMLYTSLYRSFLTPVSVFNRYFGLDCSAHLQNNATGETQGVFANTSSPFFDSLYCRCISFILRRRCDSYLLVDLVGIRQVFCGLYAINN